MAIETAVRRQEEMKLQLRQLVADVQRFEGKASDTDRQIEVKTRELK